MRIACERELRARTEICVSHWMFPKESVYQCFSQHFEVWLLTILKVEFERLSALLLPKTICPEAATAAAIA